MSIVPIPPLAGVLDLLSEILNCSSGRQNIWNYRLLYNRRKKWEPKHPWLKHWKIRKKIGRKFVERIFVCGDTVFFLLKPQRSFQVFWHVCRFDKLEDNFWVWINFYFRTFVIKKISVGGPHSHRAFVKSLRAAKEGCPLPNISIRTFSCCYRHSLWLRYWWDWKYDFHQ